MRQHQQHIEEEVKVPHNRIQLNNRRVANTEVALTNQSNSVQRLSDRGLINNDIETPATSNDLTNSTLMSKQYHLTATTS